MVLSIKNLSPTTYFKNVRSLLGTIDDAPSASSNSSIEMLNENIRDLEDTSSFIDEQAPCFVPNTERAAQLLEDQQRQQQPLGLPILNLGFPKCGSTTLFEFFKCSNYAASHQDNAVGICFRDAAANGLPLFSTCAPDVQAFLQMDSEYPIGFAGRFPVGEKRYGMLFSQTKNRDECFFPQISLLDEIHQEAPNATFVLTFRPIMDWVHSVKSWKGHLHDRLVQCNLPGLPKGAGKEDIDLVQLWCSHVIHVRKFVEQHPSHALLELYLYNNPTNSRIMSQLFNSEVSCWQHANKSGRRKSSVGQVNVALKHETLVQQRNLSLKYHYLS